MLANRVFPATCALRVVAAYICAAQRIGWDITTGHLSLWLQIRVKVSGAVCLSAMVFAGGRAAKPLHDALLLRGRLLQHAGTAVGGIMKIGGWKTESLAKHYIGSTSSGKANGSKRKRDQSYYF